MKRRFYIVWIIMISLTSCKDDDINIFDKTADQRSAEAIASLKADLVAPEHGWKVLYRPEPETGSYYVLLNFDEDDNVTIKTDLGVNNGEYFEQKITYRVDNSLGLELIFENYSFFSFLFEQDQASFGAEYEFNYVNKTPDNALVFKSKTDASSPTIITFQEATPQDQSNLLGTTLATNISTLANDLDKFTSLSLTYRDKDLVFFVSLNEFTRSITIKSASKKSDTQSIQDIDHNTAYFIKGDSMVFDAPLSGTFLGIKTTIKSIKFSNLTNTSINVCASPIPIHAYEGITSAGDVVTLETSVIDIGAKNFTQSNIYVSPLGNIFNAGASAGYAISQDIAGALEMHFYHNFPLGDGTLLNAIGFLIQNKNASYTFALRKFTATQNDNNIVFTFDPTITLFGSQTTDADITQINKYLDFLTQDDKTYIIELQKGIYEFYNPCSGWDFIFLDGSN
jgi:hypothetical protein